MGEFRPAVFQAAIDAGAAVRPATLRYREGGSTSTRGCFVGDDSLLASLLRVTATRHLDVEVTLFAPVRLAPTGRGRHEARAALARIAEAQVRAGVVEQHEEVIDQREEAVEQHEEVIDQREEAVDHRGPPTRVFPGAVTWRRYRRDAGTGTRVARRHRTTGDPERPTEPETRGCPACW